MRLEKELKPCGLPFQSRSERGGVILENSKLSLWQKNRGEDERDFGSVINTSRSRDSGRTSAKGPGELTKDKTSYFLEAPNLRSE